MDVTVEVFGTQAIISRMNAKVAHLADLSGLMLEATTIVYAATREWYDSDGNGEWVGLAPTTIIRKTHQGYSDPERPLYAEGNLYESVSSPSGPHSFRTPISHDAIVIGADWMVRGWQIPTVLATGRPNMPARPIWPSVTSSSWRLMEAKIAELFLAGV